MSKKVRHARIVRSIAALSAIVTAIAVPLLAGTSAVAASSLDRDALAMEADCFDQMTTGSAAEIDCAFPAVMEPKDRDSIRKLTREVFKDAHCLVRVRIARRLIEEAMAEPDTVFEAPPQHVSCTLETSKGDLPVTFTFAPRIEFVGGIAIAATPGMGDVEGVNAWLAWPVVEYVNASGSIEDIMLRVVNAYVRRYGPLARASQ
jgi:hypothetical protein